MKDCKWTKNLSDDTIDVEFNIWRTECGYAFIPPDGNPYNSCMKFCCFCGGKLIGIYQGRGGRMIIGFSEVTGF